MATVVSDIDSDTLQGRALKRCVKIYLIRLDALDDLRPHKVRRAIAEACHIALTRFSSNVKNRLARKRLSCESVKELLDEECYNHIPDQFKRVSVRARRSKISRDLEEETIARLLAIMEW
jgi:hypothetical protein